VRRLAAGLAACAVLSLAAAARAGEIPGAVIVLEADPGTPGADPSAAPPRFVLLKDGQVFVGGTSRLEAGRLSKAEAGALRKRAEQARKLPGLASPVALGGDGGTMRLRLPEEGGFALDAVGDPQAAPPALAPLATLLAELLSYHHPSLVPYSPASYALVVREARLVGGCRTWRFALPIAEALAGPRSLPAADAVGWPTGGVPASVCDGGRRYAVTLRPLLPGESP
jgi:hypothetical protein